MTRYFESLTLVLIVTLGHRVRDQQFARGQSCYISPRGWRTGRPTGRARAGERAGDGGH